jgi:hypothetical protein
MFLDYFDVLISKIIYFLIFNVFLNKKYFQINRYYTFKHSLKI